VKIDAERGGFNYTYHLSAIIVLTKEDKNNNVGFSEFYREIQFKGIKEEEPDKHEARRDHYGRKPVNN